MRNSAIYIYRLNNGSGSKWGHLILIMSLLLFFQTGMAQGWEQQYGQGKSRANHIIQESDGNFLVVGVENANTYFARLNKFGDLLWQQSFPDLAGIIDLKSSPDGSYILQRYESFSTQSGNYNKGYISKVDKNGQLIWSYILSELEDFDTRIGDVEVLPNGEILFAFDNGLNNFYNIVQLDADGELMSMKLLAFPTYDIIPNEEQGYFLTDLSTEDYVIVRETNELWTVIDSTHLLGVKVPAEIFPQSDGTWKAIQFFSNGEEVYKKLDAAGLLLDSTILYQSDPQTISVRLELADGFVIVGDEFSIEELTSSLLIIRADAEGELLWTKRIGHHYGSERNLDAICTIDGGMALAGYHDLLPFDTNNPTHSYVVKTDSLGNIFSNILTGVVAIDSLSDCQYTEEDGFLEDWIVTAEKEGAVFTATTNAFGLYDIALDTGDYLVNIYPPNALWQPCMNNVALEVITQDSQLVVDFQLTADISCPSMHISQTIPSIRPCFVRPAYVSYCNNGTTVAENAYIEIVYDTAIAVVSSQIPYDSLGGGVYQFPIGDLAPLDCGSFWVNLFLDCEATVGASYCAEAHAFPDSICLPPSQAWSGAFLEVNGNCENDKINLSITNIGDEDMISASNYIIIEDVLLLELDTVKLNKGANKEFSLPANGSTYTLLAKQVEGAPGLSNPIVVVEGCGLNDNGTFSIGLANQFAMDDANLFVDVDCPVAVSSFDPNDKQGFPIGYQEEHFILPETPIEYMIRFQNTGTDTAFTVVVRDTLDANFDISTLEIGSSSHAFNFELEENAILKFSFLNILLPDSTVDLSGSNGFVTFKITPKASTPLGTILNNRAGIYFDFNDPIITNTTYHTLGEEFIEVIVDAVSHPLKKNIKVNVFPNPFSQFTFFQIGNHQSDEYKMALFDAQGKIIRALSFDSSTFEFRREELPSGIYFYRITSNDGLFSSGRIIVR